MRAFTCDARWGVLRARLLGGGSALDGDGVGSRGYPGGRPTWRGCLAAGFGLGTLTTRLRARGGILWPEHASVGQPRLALVGAEG